MGDGALLMLVESAGFEPARFAPPASREPYTFGPKGQVDSDGLLTGAFSIPPRLY